MRRRLLIILGLAGLVVGAIAASLFTSLIREHNQAVAASHWTPVEAKIESFHTGYQMRKSGYVVTADVAYTYSVAGKEYKGSRLGFLMRDRFSNMAQALAAVEDLTKAAPGHVYYNPADPSESVLSIGHDFEGEYQRRFRDLVRGTAVASAVIFISLWLVWRFGRRSPARRKGSAQSG